MRGRNCQLPIGECNSWCKNVNFRPEIWDLSHRCLQHCCRTTEFKACRNYYPQSGWLKTIYMGEIVNIRSENAILCATVSISGWRFHWLPTSGRRVFRTFESSNFRPENWDPPSRHSKLSTRKTGFNTGTNYYLPAGRLYNICLWEILHSLSENDAILCVKFSTSSRRIHRLPTSGQKL